MIQEDIKNLHCWSFDQTRGVFYFKVASNIRYEFLLDEYTHKYDNPIEATGWLTVVEIDTEPIILSLDEMKDFKRVSRNFFSDHSYISFKEAMDIAADDARQHYDLDKIDKFNKHFDFR